MCVCVCARACLRVKSMFVMVHLNLPPFPPVPRASPPCMLLHTAAHQITIPPASATRCFSSSRCRAKKKKGQRIGDNIFCVCVCVCVFTQLARKERVAVMTLTNLGLVRLCEVVWLALLDQHRLAVVTKRETEAKGVRTAAGGGGGTQQQTLQCMSVRARACVRASVSVSVYANLRIACPGDVQLGPADESNNSRGASLHSLHSATCHATETCKRECVCVTVCGQNHLWCVCVCPPPPFASQANTRARTLARRCHACYAPHARP